MWIFLASLVLLSTVQTALSIALWRRRTAVIAGLCGLGVGIGLATSTAANFNLADLSTALADLGTFQAACAWQIAEAIVAALLAMGLLGRHHRGQPAGWTASVLLPGGIFLAGVFGGLVWLLNTWHGVSFTLLGLGWGAAIAGSIGGLVLLVRWGLPAWDRVLEVRVTLCALQVLLAAFAPLVVQGVVIQQTQFQVDAVQTASTLAGLCAVVVAGAGWRWLRS